VFVTGLLGFVLLGYAVGLVVGGAAFLDVLRYPRSAWRRAGRRRRSAQARIFLGWLVLGWGGVLVGVLWFTGDARRLVRLADGDIARSRGARELDLALEERKVAIAEERIRAQTVDITEVSCED
jgi:hypothetical protein